MSRCYDRAPSHALRTQHSMKTCHLVIRGRVQGVGFRAFVCEAARGAGLAGWVRNRRDGSVEAVLQGEADALEAVVARIHVGPRSAEVTDVRVAEADGRYDGFEMRPTA